MLSVLYFLLTLIILITLSFHAQRNQPCNDETYKNFNFEIQPFDGSRSMKREKRKLKKQKNMTDTEDCVLS